MARVLNLLADNRPFVADMAVAFRGVQFTGNSPHVLKCKRNVVPLKLARKILSTPGAEPEPFSLQFDLDVSEARAFEAQFERTGIYGDQSVADVNQP